MAKKSTAKAKKKVADKASGTAASKRVKSAPRKKAGKTKAVASSKPGEVPKPISIPVVVNPNVTPYQPYLFERLLTPEEVAAEYAARQEELDDQFDNARKVLKKWWRSLKKSDDFLSGHITGVSVRYRTKFGAPVSPLQVVIGVNVATKMRECDLDNCGLTKIPPAILGVPTKVVEGTFQFLATLPQAFPLSGNNTAPKNPLKFTDELVGGVPICPPGKPDQFGTLGVVLSATDGSFLGMTCQHVVGNKNTAFDQRGSDSPAGQVSVRPIGKVKAALRDDHTHSQTLTTETIDCAVLEFSQPPAGTAQIVFPPTGRWIQGLSHPAGKSPTGANIVPIYFSTIRVQKTDSDFDVYKFGSATGGVLIGKVRDVDNLFFSVNGQGFSHNFTVGHRDGNQRFVTAGDSGSILALKAEVAGKPAFVAIGVLFAQLDDSGKIGLACNMSQFLDALKPDVPGTQKISSWQFPPA